MFICVYISGVLSWPSGANSEAPAHLRPHTGSLCWSLLLPGVLVGGVRLGRPLVLKSAHKPPVEIFPFEFSRRNDLPGATPGTVYLFWTAWVPLL